MCHCETKVPGEEKKIGYLQKNNNDKEVDQIFYDTLN